MKVHANQQALFEAVPRCMKCRVIHNYVIVGENLEVQAKANKGSCQSAEDLVYCKLRSLDRVGNVVLKNVISLLSHYSVEREQRGSTEGAERDQGGSIGEHRGGTGGTRGEQERAASNLALPVVVGSYILLFVQNTSTDDKIWYSLRGMARSLIPISSLWQTRVLI